MSLSYVNVPQLFLQRVTLLFLTCHTTEVKSAALCLPKSRLPIPESHITLSKVPLFCDDGVRKVFLYARRMFVLPIRHMQACVLLLLSVCVFFVCLHESLFMCALPPCGLFLEFHDCAVYRRVGDGKAREMLHLKHFSVGVGVDERCAALERNEL